MSLLPLAILLMLGCTCEASGPFGGHADILFNELTFDDGPAVDGKRLYIQEGAIVDVICKQASGTGSWLNDRFDVDWTLGPAPGNYPVDHDIFPAEKNFEAYHSTLTGSSHGLNKALSTLRYTARMEDNGKAIFCSGVEVGVGGFASKTVPGFTGAVASLNVRPGPSPLAYKSTVEHKWRGGFVGEINIPISDYYNSWKIILKFPRKVFNLHGGHFQVANEPCLHKGNCGDDRQKTWVLYNTFANRVLNPGDHLKLTFIAEVWKKMSQGVIADVDFYGFDQVFHTDTESFASSPDIHVN
ncbi:uncharacterized protein [Amphiura filiformis]|uniref:uncharacterized protein n=1 Tax=Amphiura filiformis TaxID=82378 RepID=UPI003B20CA77